MCFHKSQTKKAVQLEDRFNARFDDVDIYQPYYHLNGFEYGIVYMIKQDETHIIEPAIWGMLPEQIDDAKEFRKKFNTLNARSETAMNSTMFSESLRERRCLILADGFFESKHVNGSTYPYYIKYKNHGSFAFAGIFNEHDSGEFSCSILTAKANPFMAEIHNTKKRMPLILDKTYENLWLKEVLQDDEIQEVISKSFTKEEFEAYTVSKDVTNSRVKSNKIDILTKVSYPALNTLF